jgi:hypothetical protein
MAVRAAGRRVIMQNENPLEAEILDRFFQQLSERDDIPFAVTEKLLSLRQQSVLANSEMSLRAIREGASGKA